MTHNEHTEWLAWAEQFRTENDWLPEAEYKAAQYTKGQELAKTATEFHIAIDGVWSTTNNDGSSTFSYERLGYHSCTYDLVVGLIDGLSEGAGCEIIDHRPQDHSGNMGIGN